MSENGKRGVDPGPNVGRGESLSGIMPGMTKPKINPVAVLVLVPLVALLSASCRHVDPRTYVPGPVTCEPKKGASNCDACVKASCCAEYQACAIEAPCPCFAVLRRKVVPSAKALEVCGPMPDTYKALAACMDSRCAACPAEDALARHPLVGLAAPEIIAEPVGGEGPKTLKDALGKVVIVDFWATWCTPCKASFPKYQAIVDQSPGDVVVLAVSVDDPESVKTEQLLTFARDTHVKFSILWDKRQRTDAAYRRPGGVLPFTVVIDRSGIVRHVHAGYGERDITTIAAEIQGLVNAAGGR